MKNRRNTLRPVRGLLLQNRNIPARPHVIHGHTLAREAKQPGKFIQPLLRGEAPRPTELQQEAAKAAAQAVFPRHRIIHLLPGPPPVRGALIPHLLHPVAGAIHPLQGPQVHHQAAQAAVAAQQGQAAAAEAAVAEAVVAEVHTAQAAAVPGEAGNNL
jgi:hypothetical protein